MTTNCRVAELCHEFIPQRPHFFGKKLTTYAIAWVRWSTTLLDTGDPDSEILRG